MKNLIRLINYSVQDLKNVFMLADEIKSGKHKNALDVAGYIDNKIIGVAGASNDYESMWQVGIDVVPEHRSKGVGTILISLLTAEILKKGIVPFYRAVWSHILSKNTAINSGYQCAWVTICADD